MSRTEADQLLEIHNMSKTYRGRRSQPVYALRNVSFSLLQGRCLGVVGESGCGKSTLCRMIAGVERPDRGEIFYEGKPVDYKRNRRDIQMVFQNSQDAVNLHLNAGCIISEPLENFFHMNRAERDREVDRLLESVGLSPEDQVKYPKQFSGGQLQRICIARALAAKPKLLLLDEPLSSLDVSVQAQLLNLLCDLKEEFQLTCILVSHDLEAVYYLADALLVMYGGAVVEELEDITAFSLLQHPYTQELLDKEPFHVDNNALQRGGLWTKGACSKETEREPSGCVYARRCKKAGEQCHRERPMLRERKKGHKLACHMIS